MNENDVFVQHGIRSVKLRQLAFRCINTRISLLDVNRGNPWVVQAEMEGYQVGK